MDENAPAWKLFSRNITTSIAAARENIPAGINEFKSVKVGQTLEEFTTSLENELGNH